MRVTCQAFWLQKAGLEADEYEDAFYPKEPADIQAPTFRCAVADGATETSFSGLWAQLLVEAYVKENHNMTALQEQWHDHIAGKQLPWYAEEKAREGAFAALVGLTLRGAMTDPYSQATWEAMAVGDSCLFHISNGEIITAFPLDRWSQFGSSPFLISSNPDRNTKLDSQILHASGQWSTGNIFYLMSDAIACWFLRRQEELQDAVAKIADKGSRLLFQIRLRAEITGRSSRAPYDAR